MKAAAKWPRVQFVFVCKTCDIKIVFSLHYGEHNIWNNKDADKLAAWMEHAGHNTQLTYEFIPDMSNALQDWKRYSKR